MLISYFSSLKITTFLMYLYTFFMCCQNKVKKGLDKMNKIYFSFKLTLK